MRELSQEEVDLVGAGPALPTVTPPSATMPRPAANGAFPDTLPIFSSNFIPSVTPGGNAE